MENDPSCRACGRPVEDSSQLCDACVRALEEYGSERVARTGEFTAVSPDRAASLLTGSESPDPPAGGAACSWCRKLQGQVKKLLSSGEVNICNECVALCAHILTAELGEDWR